MANWHHRVSNTLTKSINENIFFLHIPKCGGSSLDQAIREKYLSLDPRSDRGIIHLNAPLSTQVIATLEGLNYPHDTEDDFPILQFREKLLLYFMGQKNSRYISGHFPFSRDAYLKYGEKFTYVTVLRNPVKRWISSYFFNRYKTDKHMQSSIEIADHLGTAFGISQGYELIKFLGGARIDGNYTSIHAINRAKENLDKFEVIGFLEDLGKFSSEFYDRFQVKINIGKKNQNPMPQGYQTSTITPELMKKIYSICQPDMQVYEYALEKF